MNRRPVPVTVVSGALGAGKTSLLRHVLANRGGLRVGVVVNDVSEVAADTQLVELSDGCICCTLRGEVLEAVGRLASSGVDAIVVESTATSAPMTVAATFDWTLHDGTALSEVARLDTMVTVVDASTFLAGLRTASAGNRSERAAAQLLVEQVEFADVVVVNNSDLADEPAAPRLDAVLQQLNPGAVRVWTSRGRVPVDTVLGTGWFDTALAGLAWPRTAASEEEGIRSVLYRAARPFHPDRLAAVMAQDWPGLLRGRGLSWLATRPATAALWSQVGPHTVLEPAAAWSQLDTHRGQILVFLGQGLEPLDPYLRLDPALLDDDELRLGPQGWASMRDPLPPWAEQVGASQGNGFDQRRRAAR